MYKRRFDLVLFWIIYIVITYIASLAVYLIYLKLLSTNRARLPNIIDLNFPFLKFEVSTWLYYFHQEIYISLNTCMVLAPQPKKQKKMCKSGKPETPPSFQVKWIQFMECALCKFLKTYMCVLSIGNLLDCLCVTLFLNYIYYIVHVQGFTYCKS